jgi:hypothetical protein
MKLRKKKKKKILIAYLKLAPRELIDFTDFGNNRDSREQEVEEDEGEKDFGEEEKRLRTLLFI